MSIPVYGEIANLLNEQPNIINEISIEDIQPVLKLNLLNTDPKRRAMIRILNENHQLATDMSTEELLSLLKWSDETYYHGGGDTANLLKDTVYDYVKRVYGQRKHMTMEKEKTMLSVSSNTGVGIKPVKGRDTPLPVPLRSLDNLFKGEGDVDKFASKYKGPYNLSAKMDGTSTLYYQGVLYTRGDATVGRNISHLLKFLNLPKTITYAVRGELVIDRKLFDRKYKDKQSKTGAIRKINRNSVAGALGSVTNLDEEFLKDLTFVAYEIISMGSPIALEMRPSDQFRKLLLDGFSVAYSTVSDTVSDQVLSNMYHELIGTYNYEVDGVVVQVDKPYVREMDKNPDYAKSYKEALAQDVAVTKIISIEWNVSQYGYLVPTVIYEPVSIGGVTLQRATAHNAREVQKLGLGAGAVIEVVYRAKVNPQVNRVIKPVTPDMPKVPYKWIQTDASEPVNIMFNEDEASGENQDGSGAGAQMMDAIKIKSIHKFLVEIGAKGVGETTVEKIYEKTGYRTVGDFINMKLQDIMFLGKQASQNIYNSINTSMKNVDLPTLMASSKVFGRGLGTKKFTKVFDEYPDFALKRHNYDEYHRMFLKVDGFADKTASLAAKGMVDFWEFVDGQLSAEIYGLIVANTVKTPVPEQVPVKSASLADKHIYLTGVRDKDVEDLIVKHGGTVQSTFTASTNMLVRKNAEYTNKKTEDAEKKGIPIFTLEELKSSIVGLR